MHGFDVQVKRGRRGAANAPERIEWATVESARRGRRDLGYLVAGPFVFGYAAQRTRAFPFMGGDLGHEFFEWFPLAPLLIAGSGVPENGVHHLEHLLSIYAT